MRRAVSSSRGAMAWACLHAVILLVGLNELLHGINMPNRGARVVLSHELSLDVAPPPTCMGGCGTPGRPGPCCCSVCTPTGNMPGTECGPGRISSYGCNMGCGSFCCCPLNRTGCGKECNGDQDCPVGNCSTCGLHPSSNGVRVCGGNKSAVAVDAAVGPPQHSSLLPESSKRIAASIPLLSPEKIFPDNPNAPKPVQQNGPPAPNVEYNLGQVFGVTVPGNATAIRLYADHRESGPHIGRIFRLSDGLMLVQVTIPATAFNATAKWVQWPIPPTLLLPTTQYMVTTTSGTDSGHYWAGCPSCWLPAGSNGQHLTWPASSARFGTALDKIPGTVPQFGESYLRDIVFCPSIQTACGPLPPPPPSPRPSSIFISGPSFIERPTGGSFRRRGTYRATVLDQYGKLMAPADTVGLGWSIGGDGLPRKAVQISRPELYSDCIAVATVDASLLTDTTFVVMASLRGVSGRTRVQVAELKPTAITISGPTAVKSGATSNVTYNAVVRDQLGQPMHLESNVAIQWKVRGVPPLPQPPSGVAMTATGELVVESSVKPCSFYVVAAAPTGVTKNEFASGSLLVTVDTFDAVTFLSTNDTMLTLSAGGSAGGFRMLSLRHRTVGWEWIDSGHHIGCALPLPSPVSGAIPEWKFDGVVQNSTTATYRFISGQLELSSRWTANPGQGPVENVVTVLNKARTAEVFDSTLRSASLVLATPNSSVYSQYEKRGAGTPLPPLELFLAPGLNVSVQTGGPGHTEKEGQYIPLGFVTAEDTHGLYVGSEWELGHFNMATSDAQVSTSPSSMEEQRHILSTQLAIAPIEHADIAKHLSDDSVTIATGSPDPDVFSSFEVPAVYYGTFSGDIDAGSNVFKRWFWDYKITHSLRERPDEPWSEICWDPVTGALFNGSVPRAEPSLYAAAAATGVELLKIDCCVYGYENRSWDYNPHDWPRGFDFLPRAHAAGLKTSLYLGGSYRDVNLSTVAGRDLELKAIQERFDAGWMDMWRTDTYTAPENPLPDSFAGVTNFLHIMDTMIARNQSFRYENCANGGHFKGLALARRFTFVTTNDNAGSSVNYRQTHWLNSHALNSVQLKCDMQVGTNNLNYTLRSCLLGSWLLAMPEALDILHNAAYKAHIELYKTKQRPILRGGHVFHILPFPDGTNIDGVQYHNPQIRKGSVILFKPSASTPNNMTIPLKGLSRTAQYKLSYEDRSELDCVASGALLMDIGFNVSGMEGVEASEVIWIDQL